MSTTPIINTYYHHYYNQDVVQIERLNLEIPIQTHLIRMIEDENTRDENIFLARLRHIASAQRGEISIEDQMQIRNIIEERTRNMSNELQRGNRRFETIENFIEERIESVNENDEPQECYICYEKMDTLCRLNCNHCFHKECIKTWFQSNHTCSCPTCRNVVI